jgi:hypothetical protein
MFFSAKLIEDLIHEIVNANELAQDSVSNLIYHLKLPGNAVTKFIASVIAGEDFNEIERFPERLAYGVLDNVIVIYDKSERYQNQSRLCRKIDDIDLNLKKMSYPSKLTDIFVKDLSAFLFAIEAAGDLAMTSREPSNPELSSLTERLMEAFIIENEITRVLLSKVVKKFNKDEKTLLEGRISKTIKYGMKNEPWDDSSESLQIFCLNEPIRFKNSLRKSDNFDNIAWLTLEQVSLICRK